MVNQYVELGQILLSSIVSLSGCKTSNAFVFSEDDLRGLALISFVVRLNVSPASYNAINVSPAQP